MNKQSLKLVELRYSYLFESIKIISGNARKINIKKRSLGMLWENEYKTAQRMNKTTEQIGTKNIIIICVSIIKIIKVRNKGSLLNTNVNNYYFNILIDTFNISM